MHCCCQDDSDHSCHCTPTNGSLRRRHDVLQGSCAKASFSSSSSSFSVVHLHAGNLLVVIGVTVTVSSTKQSCMNKSVQQHRDNLTANVTRMELVSKFHMFQSSILHELIDCWLPNELRLPTHQTFLVVALLHFYCCECRESPIIMASAGEFVRELAAKELAVASATEGIGHYDGSRDKLDSHTARRVQQVAPVIVRSQDNDDNAGTASKQATIASASLVV